MVNKPEPEIRTKTIENCLSPTWNHTAVMEWDGKTDLHFLVMDQDMVKDEFLGECYLRSSDVKKGFNGTMSLTPGKKRKVKKEPVLIIKVEQNQKLLAAAVQFFDAGSTLEPPGSFASTG
eukprot:CAMPEP_0170618616 /NCGR_PEP_ID=MMETSP0224-20130122/27053_1 /TAXON_ID=285029 /ORGANISM="Togula jolla, Strain CCCM 725" /LENGTH=119 /DNA_ID=CAMNT_0010944601 /DNA_START=171 /DNA_END=531 /DNA_ORIENTATION=+